MLHSRIGRLALLFATTITFCHCDEVESVDKDDSARSKKRKKKKRKKKAEETDTEDGPDSADTGTAVAPVAPAPPPAPAVDPDAAVHAFWKQQIAACNAYNERVGNTTPPNKYFPGDADDPSRKISVVKNMGQQRFLVEDAAGNRLVTHITGNHITPPAGADSALPHVYSFCDPKVWHGTMDDGAVDEPQPVAPAPSPMPQGGGNARPASGLAADGLPVDIPAPSSKVPKPTDFDAQPKEVTVRRSSTLKCETKMVREWLQVRCFSNDLGSPHEIALTQTGGVQAYKFEAPGERMTLVIQVVHGKTSKAVFKWNNGRGFTEDVTLVVQWPRGAPRPSLYFTS